ncbi:MAG: type II toxin-antitoxin system YafQ family toxin [Clostridiales bacterium]|jgi:mRNA interferase YafQ|nr:type II toxin-antitoxin system YafQ family toxin [Clostridiales bacterium]
MLEAIYSTQFKADYKKKQKQNKDLTKLTIIMDKLLNEVELDNKQKELCLSGKYKGYKECHIEPDWLLIYCSDETTVYFVRTGSHSELFN